MSAETVYMTDVEAGEGIERVDYGTVGGLEESDVYEQAPQGTFALLPIADFEEAAEPNLGELRKRSSKEQQRLTGVLLEHGVQRPIVVNSQNNRILKGKGVLEGMKAAGYTKILVQLVDLDPVTERLVAIALGASYSRPNKDILAAELRELDALGADVDYSGLPTPELERLMGEPKPPAEKQPLYCQRCGEIVEHTGTHHA